MPARQKRPHRVPAFAAAVAVIASVYVWSRSIHHPDRRHDVASSATWATMGGNGMAMVAPGDGDEEATDWKEGGGSKDTKHLRVIGTADASAAETMTSGGGEVALPFDEAWPPLRAALCPNMVPNATAFGPVLFALARDELDMAELDADEANSESLFTKFFRGRTYVGFEYISPRNESTIYLGIWKAGHNQIRMGSKELFKGQPGTYRDHSDINGAARNDDGFDGPPGACIVTATRDPVSHFLSGYNEEEFRCQSEQKCPQPRNRLFYERYAAGTRQRFRQFVADFLVGTERAGVFAKYPHVYSTTAWLDRLASNGAGLTSYMPTMDDLSGAWPRFLHDTCPGIPDNFAHASLPLAGQHESQVDRYGFYGAAKGVWAEQGPTARALCALHAIDYACYDALPDGIPSLCKNVFASKHFSETIMRHA